VDLWDLIKLLFRRWYVAIPLLLLTVAGAVWTATNVNPEYKAEGHVQLIPPVIGPGDPSLQGKPTNPWAALGQDSAGQAIVVMLQQKAVADEIASNGLSKNYTLTMDDEWPIINIEVVGTSPQQATNTVQHLFVRIQQNVASQQVKFQVPKNQQISTQALDSGASATTERAKIIRALIVVVAVGMLLTIALTVSIDALIRRSARRRSWSDGGSWARGGLAAGTSSAAVFNGLPVPAGAVQPDAQTQVFSRIINDQPIIVPAPRPVGRTFGTGPVNGGAGATVVYQSGNAHDDMPATGNSLPDTPVSPPVGAAHIDDFADDEHHEDSTIVLPLSHGLRGNRTKDQRS
jgi:capsular polysaccharide biosynthesis protein